jgi:hypothetical protein
MTEQNPAPPVFESRSVARRPTRDNWADAGEVLRLGHWVQVNVYRFPEWRDGAYETAPTLSPLPLYNNPNSPNDGYRDASARRVLTLNASPTAGRTPAIVGPITSIDASKDLGDASGQFTVECKVAADWVGTGQSVDASGPLGADNSVHKYVEHGDWLEIVAYKSDPRVEGSPARTLMVGKVDSVALTIRPPMRGGSTVTIQGRDVGAVYEDTMVYFNPYDPLHSNPEGVDMATMLNDIAGAPTDVVADVLSLAEQPSALFGVLPEVPDSGLWAARSASSVPWGEVVRREFGASRGTVFAPSLLSPGQSTSLWDFAQTYSVSELNELYVDTDYRDLGPGAGQAGDTRKATVYMYEKPFVNLTDGVNSPWFKKRPVVVALQEVAAANLRRAGERINYLSVLIELDPVFGYDAFALCPPTADIESIKRYGLRKLELSLNLHSTSSGPAGGAVVGDEIRALRDLVLCWNLLAPYYWQGSITIQGLRADIRVGKRLVVEGGGVASFAESPFTAEGDGYDRNSEDPLKGVHTFFVEGVDYSWSAGIDPECTTVVTVSRGYKDEDRIPHMQRLYSRWRNTTEVANGLAALPPPEDPSPNTDGDL